MFDLHFHSDASDGEANLETVIAAIAARPDLELVCLADHDALAASARLATAEPRAWVGIELTSFTSGLRADLLALNVAPDDKPLTAYLAIRVAERRARFALFGELLRADGWAFEPPAAIWAKPQLASPHVVAELRRTGENTARLEALGVPASFTRNEAGVDDPIYPRLLDAYDAQIKARTETGVGRTEDLIGLVHAAGGLAVVAHPWVSVYKGGQTPKTRARRILADLATAGLDGLELWHHDQTSIPAAQAELRAVALKHDLLLTGGSDDHSRELEFLGQVVPPEIDGRPYLERIRAAARRRAR